MRFSALTGVIERRLLINFRVDPDALARVLPEPFEPLLVHDVGIAGVCLIRLGHLRPSGIPATIGVSSENAAHRIAVRLPSGRKGVYIPRRDTNSRLNTVIGGRLFPGVHHHAQFQISDSGEGFEVAMRSDDGLAAIDVSGRPTEVLQPGSVFSSVGEASRFFEGGSVGYSATKDEGRYDTLELRTTNWKVTPVAVEQVASSFFDDSSVFPSGTVEFDNALIMRGIDHQWRSGESLYCDRSLAMEHYED